MGALGEASETSGRWGLRAVVTPAGSTGVSGATVATGFSGAALSIGLVTAGAGALCWMVSLVCTWTFFILELGALCPGPPDPSLGMSFVRKGQSSFDARSQQHIPSGCKPSPDGILLASTGIPSLDTLLGDGLPSGRLLLLLEDEPRSSSNYASTMLKCFLAEGILSGQQTILVGGDSEKILASLPAPSSRSSSTSPSAPSEEKMTIAWRYRHLQTTANTVEPAAPRFGHNFDLGKRLDTSQHPPVTVLDADEMGLNRIKSLSDSKTMTRIAIQSFASPLMFENTTSAIKWLYSLKMLMRSSPAVLLATFPAHIHTPSTATHILSLADSVLSIQSFLGTPKETAPAFKDYQGFLRIVRPLRLPSSLALAIPESTDLAFKCKQRRFVIETFHLPPELGDEKTTGCSPSTNF